MAIVSPWRSRLAECRKRNEEDDMFRHRIVAVAVFAVALVSESIASAGTITLIAGKGSTIDAFIMSGEYASENFGAGHVEHTTGDGFIRDR
jgi:hypothetical protein